VLEEDALAGAPLFEISWSFATSAAFWNQAASVGWLPVVEADVVGFDDELLLDELGLVELPLVDEFGLELLDDEFGLVDELLEDEFGLVLLLEFGLVEELLDDEFGLVLLLLDGFELLLDEFELDELGLL